MRSGHCVFSDFRFCYLLQGQSFSEVPIHCQDVSVSPHSGAFPCKVLSRSSWSFPVALPRGPSPCHALLAHCTSGGLDSLTLSPLGGMPVSSDVWHCEAGSSRDDDQQRGISCWHTPTAVRVVFETFPCTIPRSGDGSNAAVNNSHGCRPPQSSRAGRAVAASTAVSHRQA